MIKFFRKIRKKLLVENRFNKYLLYAIGEIILVVIGILIALQINNWNETRQKEEKLNVVYLEVQRELALNIKKIDRAINFYEKKDSIIYLILNNKLTKQDYINNNTLGYVLEDFRTVEFQNKGYLNLNNNINLVPKKYKPILNKLSDLYENLVPLLNIGKESFNNFMESYFAQLSNTKTWYVDYSYNGNHKNEAFLDYLTNNPFYKNKAYDYNIYYSNLFLSDIKINSVEAYKALVEITGEKEGLDTSIYFQTTKDLKKYSGTFKITKTDKKYNKVKKSDILNFVTKNDQLYLIFKEKEYPIYPHAENEFIFDNKDNAKVTFLLNKKNEVIGFQFFNASYYTNWTKINN
jgi:hypothetical protein